MVWLLLFLIYYLSCIFNSHEKYWKLSLGTVRPCLKPDQKPIAWSWSLVESHQGILCNTICEPGLSSANEIGLYLQSWFYEEFWAALLIEKLCAYCPGLSTQTSLYGRRLETSSLHVCGHLKMLEVHWFASCWKWVLGTGLLGILAGWWFGDQFNKLCCVISCGWKFKLNCALLLCSSLYLVSNLQLFL